MDMLNNYFFDLVLYTKSLDAIYSMLLGDIFL